MALVARSRVSRDAKSSFADVVTLTGSSGFTVLCAGGGDAATLGGGGRGVDRLSAGGAGARDGAGATWASGIGSRRGGAASTGGVRGTGGGSVVGGATGSRDGGAGAIGGAVDATGGSSGGVEAGVVTPGDVVPLRTHPAASARTNNVLATAAALTRSSVPRLASAARPTSWT